MFAKAYDLHTCYQRHHWLLLLDYRPRVSRLALFLFVSLGTLLAVVGVGSEMCSFYGQKAATNKNRYDEVT